MLVLQHDFFSNFQYFSSLSYFITLFFTQNQEPNTILILPEMLFDLLDYFTFPVLQSLYWIANTNFLFISNIGNFTYKIYKWDLLNMNLSYKSKSQFKNIVHLSVALCVLNIWIVSLVEDFALKSSKLKIFHVYQSVQQKLESTLDKDSIFYKLGSSGLITFSDYIFLLTVLSSKYDFHYRY